MRDLQWKYVTNVYPAFQRRGTSMCACGEYMNNVLCPPIKVGDPIIKLIMWIRRDKSWKKLLRWRVECYQKYAPQYIEAFYKKELRETQDIHYWFVLNEFKSKATIKQDKPKNPRGKPVNSNLTPEQRVERKKNIIKYNVNKARWSKLMIRYNSEIEQYGSPSKRSLKSFTTINIQLVDLEARITRLGGMPKSYIGDNNV